MMPNRMYVVRDDNGLFYCGMKKWDKQLRKAQIYHSVRFAKDIVDEYTKPKCRIFEVTMSIVGEVEA